jgi:hypothetical protein
VEADLSKDFLEYLGEFEAIFETALDWEAGLFDEKNEGRKSRDTVPLNLTYTNWIRFSSHYL